MGAGNPKFKEMDLYNPETYYVEFYEYGDKEEEDYEWGCDNAVLDLQESLESRLNENGVDFKKDENMSVSEDVEASGWRQTAYTLLKNEFATVCTTSDTTLEKIVVGLIPMERDNFIKMCECRKELKDRFKFPVDVWNTGYYHCCSTMSEEDMKEIDDAIDRSYERYINTAFKPIDEIFKKTLCELYQDCVYFPCGAWTSGKLVLDNES